MRRKLFVVFSILLFCATSATAQDRLDETIAQLKTEIARREAIDHDESTPASLKSTNRENLEKARTALLNALQSKISALDKYLKTLGDSITPAETQDARAELNKLSAATRIAEPSVTKAAPIGLAPRASLAATSMTVSVPNVAANQSTLRVVTPNNNSVTDNKEIEVVVEIQPPAAQSLTLKAVVTNGTEKIDEQEFTIAKDQSSGKVTVKLGRGQNDIEIVLADDANVTANVTVSRNNIKTAFTRSIVGLEQAAAASADPEQKLFLEFNLTAPLFSKDVPIKAPVWLWINPRITSVPQQLTSSVAEFATAANFIAPFNNGKVNEIVQGTEFLGGIELKLANPFKQIASGFGDKTKVRFGMSLVLAGGMSTPFGSQQVAPQFFKVNSTVKEAFNVPDGKEFIAFVAPDRNRFFRQYYGGLRIKTYYVKEGADKKWEELDEIFPGIIDLTFGQNESVTGGGLHGGVVRIDGIYPLPFARGVYAFGSVLAKLSKPRIPSLVILQPPDTQPAFPADNVFIQQVPPRDADHYRFGVGVDLIRLLKRN